MMCSLPMEPRQNNMAIGIAALFSVFAALAAYALAPKSDMHRLFWRAAYGWQINTAFVERINLTIRQHVAAVGRGVSTLCKDEDGLQQQQTLCQGYYNFCLPHASLR